MVEVINKILATGTLAAQLFLVAGIIYFWTNKGPSPIKNFLGRHGLLLAWLTSLAAMGASLYYSEVAGFEPCFLCWWQRIFLYPQVFILGLALSRKDFGAAAYGLALAIPGAIIALYHNYLYYGGQSILPCDAFGRGASCVQLYVFEFGYITIPLMSLTAFLLTIFFLRRQQKV